MTNSITDPLVDGHEESLDTREVEVDVTPDGLATVQINRAEQLNTLNWDVIEALSEAFETLHGADGVRVIILRGSGGTFCAGADPEWLLAASDEAKSEERTLVDEIGKMLRRLWDMPALTVALVEGAAAGAGAWLASACDVVVASRDATINFWDAKLDAGPTVISPYVVEALGADEAGRLFASDRNYDGLQMQARGLVQDVVADAGEFDAVARKIAAGASGEDSPEGLTEATARRIAEAREDAGQESGSGGSPGRSRPTWAA